MALHSLALRCPLWCLVPLTQRLIYMATAQVLVIPALPVAIGRAQRLQTRASSHEHAETSGREHYVYNSGSSTERLKATIEHVFSPADARPGSTRADAPWLLGWQMNERNIVWSNDLKLRLLQRHIAAELGISDQEAQQRIIDVTSLLPGLAQRLAAIKAATVVLLCADLEARLSCAAVQLHAAVHGMANGHHDD